MRAVVLHGPGDLRVEEIADPEPGPGEVILEVDVALTCATDTKMLRVGAHPALGSLPAALGHECCGRIIAAGAGVRRSFPERVVPANSAPCDECRQCRRGRASLCASPLYLTGAFASYLRVPERIARRSLLPVPDDLPSELAAMAEPLACAVRGAARSRALPRDTVVVLGGGPQGLFLSHLLSARGCRVLVADPHPERRRRALLFGAEEAVEAPRDPSALKALMALTPGGHGADAVFAAVGQPQAWEQALELVCPGGEVNLHGGCPPGERLSVDASRLHYSEVTLQGSYHHTPDALREALALLASGRMPARELLGPAIGIADLPEVLAQGGDKRPISSLS